MPYTLIQQFSDQHVHLTFKGQFQGKDVTWDTHFFTLNDYINKIKISSSEQKQFLDIERVDSKFLKLTIALKLDTVSKPDIQKMMIMINQYKNLTLGRHEYG